jgi:peptide/nickel transport system permease protein
MGSYALRRLLQAVPTLLAVSLVLFSILHLAPGGPMAVYASAPNVDQAALEAIEERLGLHDPLPLQYVKWLKGVVTGDWGLSYKFGRPAFTVVAERLWPSILLVGTSLLFSLLLSVPFGLYSALSRNRLTRSLTSVVAMLGVSIPTFWLGLVILLVFSAKLRLIPSGGMYTLGKTNDLADLLKHLIPPALVLATLPIASWSRYLRSGMLEVINQDFIRTARSKGLSEFTVISRHALKNALLPLITLVGLQAGRLIGGAVITEQVFAWPGIGRLLAESLNARDYPVLLASFLLMAILVIVGNLLADMLYAVADPRIRLESE